MAPTHFHHGLRPALNGCRQPTLASSCRRTAVSRTSCVCSQPVRTISWWGKKPNGWLYQDPRFRRRQTPDARSSEVENATAQRGAETTRSFSKAKEEKTSSRPGWQHPMTPLLERHDMMRRQAEKTWKEMLEKDPYEALFGSSQSMLEGRGWRPLWSEVFGREVRRAPKKSSGQTSMPSKKRSAGGPSPPQFVYDPITGRMVMKEARDINNTPFWSATSNSVIDISKNSSKPQEEEDSLDSLHRALGEYDTKHGLKTPEAPNKHTDPVRESLDDYESRPRHSTYKAPIEQADPVQEALEEYDSRPKTASFNPPVEEADPLQEALSQYKPPKYSEPVPVEEVDPLQAALAEYDPKSSKASSTTPVENVDPLQEALEEYSSRPKPASTEGLSEYVDPLQSALEDYDAKSKSSPAGPIAVDPSDPLQVALSQYESGSRTKVTLKPISAEDSLNASLREYESSSKKPVLTAAVPTPDTLEECLLQYESSEKYAPASQALSAAESLQQCLGEYELMVKTTPKRPSVVAPTAEVDPLRECLREYENQPKRITPMFATPEVDALQEALSEYESRPKKSYQAPVAEQPDPVLDSLLKYEARNGGDIYTFTLSPNDPFYKYSQPVGENVDNLTPSHIRARFIQKSSQLNERSRLDKEFDRISSEVENIRKPRMPSTMSATHRYFSEKAESGALKIQPPVEEPRQEDTPESVWDGRIDSNIHDYLKAYENKSPKAYCFTPCNDLVFDIPTPQGCTTSVPISTPANCEEKALQEVSSLASRRPQSIILVHDQTTDQVTARALDANLGEPADGPQFPGSGQSPPEFPSHFSAYTPLLENYFIITYTPDTVLLQRRPQSSQDATPTEPTVLDTDSVEDLLSSDAQSIVCTFEGNPKKLVIKTSSTDIVGSTKPLPLAKALAEFDHPSLFLPYVSLLEKYDIVQHDHSALVLRRRVQDVPDQMGSHRPINPVDGTTIPLPEAPSVYFASPTGFVSYDTTSELPAPQPSLEQSEEPRNQKSEQRKTSQRRGGAVSVIKTVIWAGATCYVAGVAGELLK